MHSAKLDGVLKMIQANEENLELSKKELEEKKRIIDEYREKKIEI